MRRLSLPRIFAICSILSGFCISSASAAVQNRLSAAIAGNTRVTLPNAVHGKVRLATDLGPAAANTKLEAMTLRFSMTDAQQAALDQLLLDQQDPASPRYHQWLTPAQYAAQFGLSSADIAKVTAWLTSQGFTVTQVANSATFVSFNGTVAQAQTAFATSIHTLSLHGETHFANITDPALPSALAGVISAVTGLHNFKIKPRLRTRVVDGGISPRFTSTSTGLHYLAPGDFYTIYNETPLLNNAINGVGQTIAVMGQIDISLPDIAAFRSASGLSANVPTIKTYGTDPGGPCSTTSTTCSPNVDDLDESSLDVEWAGATAPGATILFVNSTNIFTSLIDAIDNNLAPIVSISYGECEAGLGTNELVALNPILKMANSLGITVVAPSGDDGATDCDGGEVIATNGLAVDFPGSSPYTTSMGGTMFNDALNSGTYWSSTETTLTAGSLVNAATRSALSYIPEMAWNEDVTGQTFSAGGGGASNFFAKPAWQKGTGVPNDASRDVPDLALNSAANHDGYLYCVQSSCATGFRTAAGNLNVAGGTSFSAPSFAGILALVEQKIGSRIGNANQTIYALANNSAYYNSASSTVFNDITSGNNNSPCLAGKPNCSGAPIGFSAGTGYDLATGWGTINAYNLVTDWNLVTPFGLGSIGSNLSTTTLSVSPSAVVAGATVTLTASVSGTAGPTPTGTVQFLINNIAVGAPVALAGAGASTASYTYLASCSTLGTQVAAASYSGDANYAGSKAAGIPAQGFSNQSSTVSPIQFQVTTGTCPDFNLTAPALPPTVTSGSPSVLLTLTPINNFVGTVVFSATAVETSNATPTFSFSANPITVTSANTSITTTLTLNNIVASLRAPAAPPNPDSRAPWYAAGSGVTLASLLFFTLPRRRRRLGSLLLVALSIAIVGGATGCGSKNGTVAAGNANSQAGTYSVTVTATYTPTSGSVTAHSTLVQFIVQ